MMSSISSCPDTPSIDLTPRMVMARLGYGSGVDAGGWMTEIEAAIERVKEVSAPRVSSARCRLELIRPSTVDIAGSSFESRDLLERLEGCGSCTVFLLTLGGRVDEEIDLLADRPSRQVILDAAASEAAEACARWLQRREAASAASGGARTVHRFSPGYGDFSITNQRWFLDCFEDVGVELAPSGMMLPRKSISGVIGWKTC